MMTDFQPPELEYIQLIAREIARANDLLEDLNVTLRGIGFTMSDLNVTLKDLKKIEPVGWSVKL